MTWFVVLAFASCLHAWGISVLSTPTESWEGRVNPRGLLVPAFAGRVWVELAAGRVRVEKFFVWVTEF